MKKVIVADASSTIKSVADSLLRQHGYSVICTSDGLQAWEVIQAERPDLVLAGLNLSGISGLELCRQMSGDQLVGGVPVVLLISGKDDFSEEQLISSGARGRLKKPFSPRDLLEVISKLIGSGEGVSPEQQIAREGTPQTSYQANVISSTTRHLSKDTGQVYNLNWTDLQDKDIEIPDEPEKVASLDTSEQDQELLIEEDQFNLIRESAEDEVSDTSSESEEDEDYNWFIGEMKREMEGPVSAGKPQAPGPTEEKSSIKAKPSSPDFLNYDDLRPSESGQAARRDSRTAVEGKPGPEKVVEAARPRAELSGAEIDKIAEIVASKLAAHIAAQIDRKTIFEAIKSVLDSPDR
jgi:CheY-like chemotaxis protein